MHDMVIKGAKADTSTGDVLCEIGITYGRIAALGQDLSYARKVIDAPGLIAIHGGIDSHVHIWQPSGPGIEMADQFTSATRSAAYGGNTTVLPFCLPEEGQALREAITAYHAKANCNCLTDVSFHLIAKSTDPVTLGQDLLALIQAGHSSFKVFMTYEGLALSDRQFLAVMEVAKAHGTIVMVHAENEDAIEFLRERAERLGDTVPYHHATTRLVPVEREAAHIAMTLAAIADVPLTIVNVSNGETLEKIRRNRARGVRVFAETCPQYITLTAVRLDRSGFDGSKNVCYPPPRDKGAHRDFWAGIERGDFELFSSDHYPFRFADSAGKDVPGARRSFRSIPDGTPGVETRLPILFSEGVVKGRISLEKFAMLTATNHALLYGLAPRKGGDCPGCRCRHHALEPRHHAQDHASRPPSRLGLHALGRVRGQGLACAYQFARPHDCAEWRSRGPAAGRASRARGRARAGPGMTWIGTARSARLLKGCAKHDELIAERRV